MFCCCGLGQKVVLSPKYFIRITELVTNMGQPENQFGNDGPSAAIPFQQDRPVGEPARKGPVGRLIGTLLSPGETFQDINRKPTIVSPIVISILVGIVLSLFVSWQGKPNWKEIARNQIVRQSEKLGTKPDPEQLDNQIKVTAIFYQYMPLAILIFVPIFYLAGAGILALGMLLLQAQTTYKKVLSVFAWTFCSVGLVTTVVVMASLLVRDPQSLQDRDFLNPAGIAPTNLSFVVPDESSPALRALCSSLDVFSIWTIVLLIIGLVLIGGTKKITKGKTATLVIGLWVLIVLLKVGAAAVGLGGT